MKRSAAWPWGRIGVICFLTGMGLLAVSLIFDGWWSFLTGGFIWFAAYSAGRDDQMSAMGIKKIEFVSEGEK